MRKPLWNKELVMIFTGEDGAIPLTKRWGISPDIDGDIKDLAFKDVNQLSLGSWILKMKSPQDAFLGPGEVILNKMTIKACLGVAPEAPGFLKVASAITKNSRLDEEKS